MSEIIFCPVLYVDIEKDLSLSKKPNPVSGHKFQENIIKGLIANNCNFFVINTPRIRSFPYTSKIFVKSSDYIIDGRRIGVNIGFVNLPIISRITKCYSFRKKLLEEIKRRNESTCFLMTVNSYDIQSRVFFDLKKKNHKLITCDIVADLHGNYGIKNSTKGIRGYFINKIEMEQDRYSKLFDSYVLLTEEMKRAIGIRNKPYIVVEGMYEIDESITTSEKHDDDIKTIFYAGSLSLEYGIEHLLNAFSLIENNNYRLVIAGAGNAEELIKQWANKDERIVYLGYVSPIEVKRLQDKSDVLVSPRQTNHSYVKYSFPSKTMECLASGKPYVAHKLPCEPEEYQNYILYPDDESDLALRDKLEYVCELPIEDRKKIGIKAREFIRTRKNPLIMCKKILDMVENIGDSLWQCRGI